MNKDILQEAEERERELWRASQQFMHEGIGLEELGEIKNTQSESLKNAILTLSKQDVRQSLLRKIYGAFIRRHNIALV